MTPVVPPNPVPLYSTSLLRALIDELAAALMPVPLLEIVLLLTVRLALAAVVDTPAVELVEIRESLTVTKLFADDATTPLVFPSM
jgi:hypothetical protein